MINFIIIAHFNWTFIFFLDIPALWHSRLRLYSDHSQKASKEISHNLGDKDEQVVTQPSKFGNFIYSSDHDKHAKQHSKKLICYYTTPRYTTTSSINQRRNVAESTLKIKDINPHLCTHLNIGIIDISNCTLVIDDDLIKAFQDSSSLKGKNEKLKVLLWVGGADESTGFSEMVENHANRKRFIQSLKATLEKYSLDGVGEFCMRDLMFIVQF